VDVFSAVPQTESICIQCSRLSRVPVKKLQLEIKLSMAPPGTEPLLLACPYCSDVWEDLGATPLSRGTGDLAPVMNRGDGYRDTRAPLYPLQPQVAVPNRRAPVPIPMDIDVEPPRPLPYHSNNHNNHYVPIEPSDYGAAASGAGFRGKAGGRGGRAAFANGRGAAGRAGRGGRSFQASTSTVVVTEGPQCMCGEPSVRRNVVKEGPNKGKGFYACAKSR